MALRIRLMRLGTKHKPHYKIAVSDKGRARNSKFVEEIGFYNPGYNPSLFKVDQKRLEYWLKVGAKPTKTVESLLKKADVV